MLIYPSLYLPIFRRKKRILTRFIRDIVTKLLGFRRTQNIYFLCLLANLVQKEGPQKSKDKHTECFTGKHTETCKLTGTCKYLYLQGIQFICQFQHTSVLHPLLIVLRKYHPWTWNVWHDILSIFFVLIHEIRHQKILLVTQDRSSRPEVFCKKGVFRNFAKFTAKHIRQSLFGSLPVVSKRLHEYA